MNHRSIASFVTLAALTLAAYSCVQPMGTDVGLGDIAFFVFQDADSDFTTSDVNQLGAKSGIRRAG